MGRRVQIGRETAGEVPEGSPAPAASTIRRSAAHLGGVDALASYLDVTMPEVLSWIAGKAVPADRALARAAAVVAATETQRLMLRDLARNGEPPPNESD